MASLFYQNLDSALTGPREFYKIIQLFGYRQIFDRFISPLQPTTLLLPTLIAFAVGISDNPAVFNIRLRGMANLLKP